MTWYFILGFLAWVCIAIGVGLLVGQVCHLNDPLDHDPGDDC